MNIDLKNVINPAKLLKQLEKITFENLSEEQSAVLISLKEMKERMNHTINSSLIDKDYFPSLRYFDKDGVPMSFWEWSGYINDPEYKIIQQDKIGHFFVSTVWLGMDHGFGRYFFKEEASEKYQPIIFETMIFNDLEDQDEENCSLNNYQERYSTLNEAQEGHKIACALAINEINENKKIWKKK